ncbi:MAG: ABC transporter permease subunit [Firmicutes bacterium]|nr:ABC transporter permease subunit [Bacillota bacterium]
MLVDRLIPLSPKQPASNGPCFFYLLCILGVLSLLILAVSFFNERISEKLVSSGPVFAGGILVLNIVNIVCGKFALLPVLFFPSLDRIFEVFINDRELLGECVLSSFKLLLYGYAIGGSLGLLTGILIGFNKTFSYWMDPFTKIIGPIPPTSWSPLVLSLFSTSYQAAIFMITLSVWFPITIMTSNGIRNISQAYFEVADTFGAKKLYKILHVGIPAALPSVFLGLFYATTGSFVTLITAEMFGCKLGIGWYLNWQKSMMLYANVYAGLILLALLCNIALKFLFVFREKALNWQKGVIKW